MRAGILAFRRRVAVYVLSSGCMSICLATIALGAFLLGWGGHALAAEAVQPGSIELYPTYTALGLEVSYSNDDNHNATAEFVWRRKGEQTWRNGVGMTFDRGRRLAWASVWPLGQGETIEVKVSFSDPDAADLTPLEASATTRTMILEPTGGHQFFVSPSGDDHNPGTKSRPFKTLAHASTRVRPGDIVYATSGVYHEGNLFKGLKGTAEKPIVFAAAKGHKPVLDGAIEIDKGSGAWKKHDGDVYVTSVDFYRGYAGYVAQDGLRMYRHTSLADVNSSRLKRKRAWYYDENAKKLYVRTGDRLDANHHTYNIARYEFGLLLEGSQHIVARGFEIRYYGNAAVRITAGARGCVVIDNVIHNAPWGVFMRGETTYNNAVWRNRIYEPGLGEFTWSEIKQSGYPRQGICGTSGRGTSICYNKINGWFDGIAMASWQHPERLDLNRDLDTMYNQIINTGDDAIEPDGGGVNMRIHGNRIRNCFAAISLAPVERGPVYCTRNDATYYYLMFKLNVAGCTSLGWAYIYHNSGYCLTKPGTYGGTAVSFPSGATIPISNKVLKNNAFICDGLGVRYGHQGYTIDYNCYYTVPGARPARFQWEAKDPTGKWKARTYPTIEEFSAASGQESHGIYADPQFSSTPGLGANLRRDYHTTAFIVYPQVRDTSEGDLHLKDSSPCIDKGVVIRGINEDYSGSAPDVGAFERAARSTETITAAAGETFPLACSKSRWLHPVAPFWTASTQE